MWKYVKTLQYPINIKKKDLKMAKYLITQYGGAFHNRDFRKDEVMNNYCKHLKKRKNKPYCNIIKKEISFSCCQECENKEYKNDIMISKKSGCKWKSPVVSGKIAQSSALSLQSSVKSAVKVQYKSKKLKKLERNRRSVFTNDLEHCYLCGRKKDDLHEIYSGRNRLNSIKYNFVLPLCRECHSLNQNSLVFNDYWHKQGQLYWEEFIGTRVEFIKVFRINYL